MRAFVVLCLVAAASAQYDYTPQSGGNLGGYGGQGTLGGYGGQSALGGYASHGVQEGQGVHGGSSSYSQSKNTAEYNKEFFSYSVDDKEFQDGDNTDNLVNSLKKNLRVIFIKGPESTGLENAAVQLAKSAADQRTAIYVLNKQADLSELANKLNSLSSNGGHKPEVHFVKYRTQADAENAQRAIQSQYDSSLPGPSSSTSGGHAPVHDYASKSQAAPANSYIPPSPPQASYLPPGRRV